MKSKILIFLLLNLLLQSCFYVALLIGYKYKITNNYIKSNHAFYQGFQFSKLKVGSFDSIGIPKVYERVYSVYLEIDDEDGKQSKKIYFYKPNSNYYWSDDTVVKHPILPLKMRKNSWYIIDGLVFWGNPTLSIFIYIDKLGKCHQYTVTHISNW